MYENKQVNNKLKTKSQHNKHSQQTQSQVEKHGPYQ
jgi:hypothetical protein